MHSEAAKHTEKAETEERIFKAALAEFAEKGKAGARMQKIADRAEINKAMLHYYFRSKEKLYEAVFEYVFRRFANQEMQLSLQHATTFKDTLWAFINGFIDVHHRDVAVIKLMANENLSGGTTMGKIISRIEHEASPPSVFVRKTMDAVARGEIRPVEPHHLLLTIISSCVFFFIWSPTIKTKFPDAASDWDGFVQARKEHVFDMIYHGLIVRDDNLDLAK